MIIPYIFYMKDIPNIFKMFVVFLFIRTKKLIYFSVFSHKHSKPLELNLSSNYFSLDENFSLNCCA